MATSRALLAATLLCTLAVSALAAPEDYCPGGDWGSEGTITKFVAGPCLQISGIGAIESPAKTMYIIDRSDLQNTWITGADGHLAYAEEVDLATGDQRGLMVRTNTFCSTGQFLPDGTFVSIGGDNPDGGGFSIRKLKQGEDFTVDPADDMTSKRWYPTSQLLPDGRVLIVGGTEVGADMNSARVDNPTLEYYPRNGQGNFRVNFLAEALPYNLYPNVHLLPSGRVFIFAGSGYTLWDTDKNEEVGQYNFIGAKDGDDDVFHSYPLTGTSFLFPLNPGMGYEAQVMICGGQSRRAKPNQGKLGDVTVQAHQYCYRIKPEANKPEWVQERMSVPRVMPNSVLLPDGTVLILGGAKNGYAGIPNFSQFPTNLADQYDTRRGKWHGKPLAVSNVNRLYHASAVLLHDATVWVSGGNPNSGIVMDNGDGKTEFRSEYFYPPYFANGESPTITKAPGNLDVGSEFQVELDGPADKAAGAFRAVMAYPGFSTHSANHGMRNIELEITAVEGKGPYVLTLKAPANKNVAPPTYYWLFVLIDDVPNRDGHAVWINN